MLTRLEPSAGGQGDAAGLAAAKRAERAVQGKVIQSDRLQIGQPRLHLFEHDAADAAIPRRQFQAADELGGLADLHRADLGDVRPPIRAARPRAGAAIRRRRGKPAAPPAAEENADVHLVLPPLQPGEKPVRPPNFRSGTPCTTTSRCRWVNCEKASVHRHAEVAGQGQQFFQLVRVGRRVPRGNRPPASDLFASGTTRSMSTLITLPKPSHCGQAPKGLVEAVQPRLGRRILDAAVLARQSRAEANPPPRPAVNGKRPPFPPAAGRGEATSPLVPLSLWERPTFGRRPG